MEPKNIVLKKPMEVCYTALTPGYPNDCRPRGSYPFFSFSHSGWPLRKGNHVDPNPHGYSFSRSQGGGNLLRRWDDYLENQEVGPPMMSWLTSADSGWAYNAALDDLVENLRGGTDLSVDAFQAKQTGVMFNAAKQIEDMAKNLRSSKLKAIGSLWLQLQYGWKPLLSSVYGAADESLRYVANNLSTYKGRGLSRNWDYAFMPDSSGVCTLKAIKRSRAEVTISVTIDHSKEINWAHWTSLNPISIGWELLPYSFVVDWFYDVGGFLRATETALLYRRAFKSGFVSDFKRASYSPARSDYRTDTTTWNGSAERVDFSRSLLGGFPHPQRPMLKIGLGSGRLLNAAGLLSQFLGRK